LPEKPNVGVAKVNVEAIPKGEIKAYSGYDEADGFAPLRENRVFATQKVDKYVVRQGTAVCLRRIGCFYLFKTFHRPLPNTLPNTD